MRKLALLAVLLSGLAGCMTTPTQSHSPQGNYSQNADAANAKKIADDVVRKLVALYPPASTRFDLQHPTANFFGTYLLESMRAKGYAVQEFDAARKAIGTGAAGTSTFNLAYLLDQGNNSDLYRVSLVINHDQSLDRVYQLKDGTIYPASYWVRKE